MKRTKFRTAKQIAQSNQPNRETVSHRIYEHLLEVLDQEAEKVGITRSKLLEGIVEDWVRTQGYDV